MSYIRSTYEVLAFKVLNRDVGESWIEWAHQMILRGHETEHLIILAGVSRPYNQFYLRDLTSEVLRELSLDVGAQERVLRNYSAYLAGEVLEGKRNYREVLQELKDTYIGLDYEKFLFDFYLLFYAMDELEYADDQQYWPNATRRNIHSIITEYFRNWIREQEGYRYKMIE